MNRVNLVDREKLLSRGVQAALVCYWAALFVATHIPKVPSGVAHVSDKLMHYLAYGGLAFLLEAALTTRWQLQTEHYVTLFSIVAIYGIADELIQIPVGRSAEVGDWLADITGAACGLAAFAMVRYVRLRV